MAGIYCSATIILQKVKESPRSRMDAGVAGWFLFVFFKACCLSWMQLF